MIHYYRTEWLDNIAPTLMLAGLPRLYPRTMSGHPDIVIPNGKMVYLNSRTEVQLHFDTPADELMFRLKYL